MLGLGRRASPCWPSITFILAEMKDDGAKYGPSLRAKPEMKAILAGLFLILVKIKVMIGQQGLK